VNEDPRKELKKGGVEEGGLPEGLYWAKRPKSEKERGKIRRRRKKMGGKQAKLKFRGPQKALREKKARSRGQEGRRGKRGERLVVQTRDASSPRMK